MKTARKQILISFVAGILVGLIGGVCCAPYYLHRHRGRGNFQQQLLGRFSSQLKLSPQQQSRVAEILETSRQKIDALRAEIQPKFEEIRTSTSADIRGILTPEQQKAFDVMNAKFEARSKRFHKRFHEGAP